MQITERIQALIKRIVFALLLVFFFGFLVLLVFFNPGELIFSLGIRNSLIIVFFVCLAGAFTSLTAISAYPMVISLVAGEVGPLTAGTVAGLGLAAGDLLFFMFGYSARDLTGERVRKALEKALLRLQKYNSLVVQGAIFVYVAFTPFPNNVLSGALAFVGYPLRKAFLPLILGDVAFCLLVAWLAHQGFRLV